MNPLLWTWFLSLTGASLFFGAGAVFNARRLAPHGKFSLRDLFEPQLLESSNPERERPDPSLAFEMPRSPAPDAEAQLTSSRARCAALEREIERHNADRALLAGELDTTRKRAEEQRRLAGAEFDSLRSRLDDKLRGGGDAATAALHHELAMSRETARAQTAKLEELRHENARLRVTEDELARAKRELSNLVAQTRDLRAQAYASKTPPRKSSSAPPKISTLSGALQSIVDSETRSSSSVKSAVIADELGLLVAASGASHEYGDALAALGAYLADVGTKTRDVLPLNEVRQVVVRDDRDMTLTVRPLVSDDAGLALVTLSVDPKPIVTHS